MTHLGDFCDGSGTLRTTSFLELLVRLSRDDHDDDDDDDQHRHSHCNTDDDGQVIDLASYRQTYRHAPIVEYTTKIRA